MGKTNPKPNINEEEIYKFENIDERVVRKQQKVAVFKSLHRNTMVFLDPDNFIKFTNHIFRTEDEDMAEFLRHHPSFGTEIFEGEFPEHILKKFEEDKKFIAHFELSPEENSDFVY